MVAKAIALGPLDADLILLGNEQTAPRSLLPEQAGKIAGEAVTEAVRLALAGDVDAIVTGRSTSTPCISPDSATPASPSSCPISPATWTSR